MSYNHLIDLDQLTSSELEDIIKLAGDIHDNPQEYVNCCSGKIMATLFYEPSTRTAMSFRAAMLRLGGQVIGFENPGNSSVAKGESLKDTIRVVSGYSDLIVIRHPIAGAPKAASLYAKCPVINAGDGGHLHPTQTLTDLVTLSHIKGRLSGLVIGVCGDLKYGRTVHSLIKCLSKYPNNHFVLISTDKLQVPSYLLDVMDANGCTYEISKSLSKKIGSLDVLYMTRIQRERFETEEEYNSQKGIYVLDGEKMKLAKKDLCILHPLPKVDEITDDVDEDPRAKYFEQAEYGMYARMALIIRMLEKGKIKVKAIPEGNRLVKCSNPDCITKTETYLPNIFKESGDMLVCGYCDERTLI